MHVNFRFRWLMTYFEERPYFFHGDVVLTNHDINFHVSDYFSRKCKCEIVYLCLVIKKKNYSLEQQDDFSLNIWIKAENFLYYTAIYDLKISI